MTRKTTALALTTVLTAAGLVVTTSPAQAAPAGCPRASFCVWRNTGWSGGIYTASGSDWWWGNDNFSGTSVSVADDDSSWFNNGILNGDDPTYVRVYDDYYQTGATTICLRYGTGFSSRPASNDRGGSHGWYYGC
ncbi:peptidase inhibitor family I36 protein [Actinoplanes sp. NPDC051861]|uniref:peptidase inhibitor family I36 protein n=1 Tax=Actinoplanes sp. NPDC051861 TaxID=3155170 RepID=UPI00342EF15E